MNAVALASGAIETPLGLMRACATDEGLCVLEFAEGWTCERHRADLERRFGAGVVPTDRPHPHFDSIARELREYFAGARTRFETPLDLFGTLWDLRVWDALLAIPVGETRSYEDVARALGNPNGSRAVGLANGRNRVAVVVPCHRVTQKDGSLGGYGGGLWRKARLLEIERKATGRALFV